MEPVKSANGLLSTVRPLLQDLRHISYLLSLNTQVAYQAGPKAKPVYALEGSSEFRLSPTNIHGYTFPKVAVAGSAIKWYEPSSSVHAWRINIDPPQVA